MLHGGYVVFRDIPVGIEGAVSLRSKGVRNLSTPFPPFWGEIISLDGVVYCHPIFQDESLYSGTPHTYIGCRDLRPPCPKMGQGAQTRKVFDEEAFCLHVYLLEGYARIIKT